jgi:hypothetical protein
MTTDLGQHNLSRCAEISWRTSFWEGVIEATKDQSGTEPRPLIERLVTGRRSQTAWKAVAEANSIGNQAFLRMGSPVRSFSITM